MFYPSNLLSKFLLLALVSAVAAAAASSEAVTTYEGTITVPTYEHSGRETEPPLFSNSTLTGLYPFTTYSMPFKADSPQKRDYQAVYLENEYLKITYIPDFGGRLFSVYDKLRGREMFYRNDVIKPAPYNPRDSWVQSGLELTGPHDLHTLTLHREPFWSNTVVQHSDGSVSLVLGEIDPVYRMQVTLSATLYPDIAAVEMAVSCYNPRDARMPQMFWMNSAISATPKTRFIYPMSRTVGHTTAEIADWPTYNGIDYSWDRNNTHMLGVFGIDSYDNFGGAYQFDLDYGIFRYADRRVVQGMKLWTFGYGEAAKISEQGYTDKAGPYVELQSGRHVWDGHYEWVAPHKTESWKEWWIPVSKTGGLTTLTRDIALNLDVAQSTIKITLASTRVISGATLTVTAHNGELIKKTINLDPAKPLQLTQDNLPAGVDALTGLVVRVTDRNGSDLLNYRRPDANPGRTEYSVFTRPLEQPRKPQEQLTVEELTLAAEYRLKELDEAGAQALLTQALAKDPGFSRAHLLLGVTAFTDGKYEEAVSHLNKAIERDAYSDEAQYYLAMSQFALGRDAEAERTLYYIWPNSAWYGSREFHLGRLALSRKDIDSAVAHLTTAVLANGYDLLSRFALAVTDRQAGNHAEAAKQLDEIELLDPTDRTVAAERWLTDGAEKEKEKLLRLTGSQTQEAINLVSAYRNLGRWSDSVKLLTLIETNNKDPWGTTPEFYYILAFCERKARDLNAANLSLEKAQTAAGKVDRFPYREESEAPLAEAVRLNPKDDLAAFDLACLLYSRGKPQDAIRLWETAVALRPETFSYRRELGLAYAEQSFPIEKASAELERAIEIEPQHLHTLNDLAAIYARAGQFDQELTLLNKAFGRAPANDDLAEGVLTAYLNKGDYISAEHLISAHRFAPRHRSYELRDKYRLMHEGVGAKAFNMRDYRAALAHFQAALNPPVSLGVDTFQSQSSPQLYFYLGETYTKLGQQQQAKQAYEKAIAGIEQLSGDRDSWNTENYFAVLALTRLRRSPEAERLQAHFKAFADTEVDDRQPVHRAAAAYLLALIEKHEGKTTEAENLLKRATEAQPDLLAARLELRGDVVDPLLKR